MAPTNIITVDMTDGWRGNNGGTVSYSTDGVTLVGTADGQGAVFDIPAQFMEGAVIDFLINVSTEYKTSGQDLQPLAQLKGGSYPGEYQCWVNNADLTPGTDQTVSCTISEGGVFDQTDLLIQTGVQVKGTTFAGTVLIKSVTVTLPLP